MQNLGSLIELATCRGQGTPNFQALSSCYFRTSFMILTSSNKNMLMVGHNCITKTSLIEKSKTSYSLLPKKISINSNEFISLITRIKGETRA
jgi:hypothetical protein